MKPGIVSTLLWLLAIVLTLALAVFQRVSGPTHPLRGEAEVGGVEISYRLLRSHGGEGDLPVRVTAPGPTVDGTVEWRRFPTEDPWQAVPMQRQGEELAVSVPHQPPAGKVEYRILLESESGDRVAVPADEAVVARFKGAVPGSVLLPHILAMFMGMLVSTRAVLEVLRRDEGTGSRWMVGTAFALLAVGGLILGPVVQKYAFGAFWTGWPFGSDLTDNKTLLGILAWLPALVAAFKGQRLRVKVIVAWVVMMGVFLIPHSAHGSEIDWSQQPGP